MIDDRDQVTTELILKRCRAIKEYRLCINEAEDFVVGTMATKAISFDLERIGEMAAHYSESFKRAHPNLPWNQLKGMCNLIAHDYENIRPKEIYTTVFADIDSLDAILSQELNK